MSDILAKITATKIKEVAAAKAALPLAALETEPDRRRPCARSPRH